jgi:hypothetical protein
VATITDEQMRQAEDAVLRVLTNGEPVTHEILDALIALGWAPQEAPRPETVAESWKLTAQKILAENPELRSHPSMSVLEAQEHQRRMAEEA